ncbi:MAG TPA: UDP-3-O-(3-hydroxymyristoyl)glucosamine N-acyltransferase [Terracidiphilus sp.]|nr:UDP-3-O-(3-hydroxymyristoyl)glucosamine N-acyltransferase [Terracidiphilus sp.]
MTLGELIEKLGGTLVQGDPEWSVEEVKAYEHASPFDLVFADSAEAAATALSSGAGAVVLKSGATATYPHAKSIIESDQPRLWFARAAKLLTKPSLSSGVHKAAVVSSDANLAAGVVVGAGAVIGPHVEVGDSTHIGAGAVIGDGVKIGEHCHIYPRAVLYPGTAIGDRVIVHAGAVLGADGFGYVRDEATGAYTQFPQKGTLVIEDDVEIGANSTIDRGALAETRIRRGTKIDNLVHVGHNCDIGEDVILVALTGISGSSTVGKGALLAGQVGIGDHAHVGPGVILGGQSGVFNGKTVTNDGLRPGTVLYGTPARPLKQVLREQATLARLAKRRGKELTDAGE